MRTATKFYTMKIINKQIGKKNNKIPIVMKMTLPCHFLVFLIFHPNNKQQTTFTGAKKPNKEMMDAATRGITKAGTSENTMRVRVDDDFLHQELLDLNETIRDYHRLTMYFPNKTRLIYGEWYGKCLGMGVHTVVFGIFLYRWWLSPPMNEKICPSLSNWITKRML